MKIEVRSLQHNAGLSEETHAFTATIYVDGKPAFYASNHGHGGPDLYRPVEGYTGPSEKDVNAFLATSKPADTEYGITLEHCLEFEVCDQINQQLGRKVLNRMLRSKVVVIVKDGEREALASYKASFKPTAENIAKIRARGELVVNGNPELEARALALV